MDGESEVITHCVLSILYYLVLFIFLIKIRILLVNMINNEELKEEEGRKYLNSFKKFFVFVGGSFSSLILSIVGYKLLELNLSAIVYYIFIYPLCLLDVLLYPFIVFVFCFKPIPLNKLCLCYNKNANNDNDFNDINDDNDNIVISLLTQ